MFTLDSNEPMKNLDIFIQPIRLHPADAFLRRENKTCHTWRQSSSEVIFTESQLKSGMSYKHHVIIMESHCIYQSEANLSFG